MKAAEPRDSTQKILIMGAKNAGKTCIQATLFADFSAFDTKSIPFTNSIIENKVQFLGHNLRINDCGGQKELMQHYLKSNFSELFRSVGFLIYVFDIMSQEREDELRIYELITQKLVENSPTARIFILLHKIDLIPVQSQEATIADRRRQIELKSNKGVVAGIFATSIFNSSLYSAWSQIIKDIIPDLTLCDRTLSSVAKTMLCDEIVLVEKLTFLVLGSYSAEKRTDNDARYFKLSRMIKSFKIECSKNGKEITSVVIRNPDFSVVMHGFTPNTYVFLMFYGRECKPALVMKNLEFAGRIFQNNKDSELKNLQHIW